MAEIRLWYDREGDVLEVVFDESPAYLEEKSEDIFERRSVDGRIIGFTVLNFSKHDRSQLTLPVAVTAVAAA